MRHPCFSRSGATSSRASSDSAPQTFHTLEPNIPVLIYTTFMAPLAMLLVIYNRIRVRGARAAQS